MKFLRCKLYVGPFSALHWDLFKHGASSHLHPVTTTKCKLHFLSTTESLAVSRIHVARKSSESFPGKLNIKPKAENVTAVHNRTVSKVNDGKTKKHGLKSKAAMSTEIPPKGKMNATKKFDDYNEHADQMLFGNSEVYTRKKLIEIYQQKLLFQASRRIATGKVKALKVDTDTSVKNMKRIFFATNFRHNLQDNKLVLEEDIQRTAIYLENAAKRNSKYPPFDKVLLTKAAKVLNEELLGSAERKSLLYCARNVDRIDRSFETAKIGTQICIMSNKLPLALPIITSAFRKRLILIEKIRSVDASFDCSNLKSDKYQQMFCMFFKHAVLSDPRASYVDWAMEMLSRDQMTPSLEFLVSSLTLLDKCDQKSTHGKALIGHLLGHEKEVLENIEGFSIGDLRYFFKNILQRLAVKYETPVPTDNVVPVFEDATMNHAFRRYSMLQPDDNCLPLSREKIPPQFKLSDILTYDELIDNYQRQLQYENLVNVPVTSIEAVDLDMECSKNSKGKNKKIRFFHKGKELDGHNMKEIDDILKDWHRKMLDEIVEALHSQKRGNLFDKDLYEIFQVIDLKALIDHLIDIALTIGANEMAMPHFQINSLIGQFLFNSFYQQFLTRTRYMEKLDKIYPEYAKIFFDEKKTLQVCAREEWIKLQNKYSHMGPGIHDFPSMWPSHSCHYLCKLLITILLKHCQVPTNVAEKYSLRGFENDQNVGVKNSRWKSLPCLSFRYITHNAGKTRVSARTHLTVYPHLFFTMMARATNRSEIKMLATAIPTLVPPVPICSQNHGGYLVSPSQFLRLGVTNETDSLSKDAVLKKIFVNHPDMDGIYDSVYTFSSVPWKINRQVFDIVSYLFKSGGDLELDIPLDENKMRLHLEKSSSNSTSKTDEIQLFKRAKELKQAENNNYGLRMSLLYQLSIAERMKNEKAFWFPSNMDFRGRCYDIPPVFNHIGDDKTRSLLMFAQGKPLGDSGFMWLKLQLASLSGNCKKMSYADRIQYVDSHMELILDSAAKPLSGFKWWTTLDEPFQCLACCFEISNAIKSGDVTKFVSHLPIHQDGSCNGLQHYAALGRDSEGALQVNVLPAEKPQDVYQAVTDIVEKQRKREKSEPFVEISKNLQGMISRKVVKQTVMTQVYGVTFFGGRQQIESKLKDVSSFEGPELYRSASYITKQVFDGVQDLFTATAKIKEWLRTLSWYLAEAGIFTEWVSPMGLPIVQPYSKRANHRFSDGAGDSSVVKLKNRPNSVKQRNAFAPNYIHCLDAVHMLLTSRSCFKNGVSFVHVHDCFWTHACSVEDMNRICRDEFIKLHSLPLLNDLSDYVSQNLLPQIQDAQLKIKLEKHLKNIPERGDLILEKVKDSTFFFS